MAMTTFRQLLDQFDESAKTLTAKGRRFEQFCDAFFKLAKLDVAGSNPVPRS